MAKTRCFLGAPPSAGGFVAVAFLATGFFTAFFAAAFFAAAFLASAFLASAFFAAAFLVGVFVFVFTAAMLPRCYHAPRSGVALARPGSATGRYSGGHGRASGKPPSLGNGRCCKELASLTLG